MDQGAGLELSPEVQELLRQHVTSLEQLEAILLLRRSAPRQWTVPEISAAIRIPENLVEFALQCLSLAGLAAASHFDSAPRYRYAPQNGQLDGAVAALAFAYSEHPSATIRFIGRNAIDRIRSSASRAFADAFLIRKRDKDG